MSDDKSRDDKSRDDSPLLLVDGHLDLAFSAVQIGRDLTHTVASVRAHDPEAIMNSFGSCTVTLPALRRGRVGIVFGTVMSRIDPNDTWTRTGMYCQQQCYGIGRGHAAYYQALEHDGEIRIIHTVSDLEDVLAAWQRPAPNTPVGLVLTMEGADSILGADQVPEWHSRGLRMVGIAHYGTSSYSHGTGTEGGLLPRAKHLLDALKKARIVVDMSHLTDQAFWELLDIYDGPIAASHHNCRTLVPGQRQLTDAMIRAIAQRDGVIGTSCDAWMLDPCWRRETPACEQLTAARLDTIADHIDYVAQLTGTVRHCGVGSDLDGGFGAEQAPRDLDTIADLQQLAHIFTNRGYTLDHIRAVFSDNWLRLLRTAMPSRRETAEARDGAS